MKKVRFITLGCRVNQYETQGMREAMGSAGYQSVSPSRRTHLEDVDFVVINTCTVTNEADKENRYWIRRARREHPLAKIVVTGCGVERDRESIEALDEVDLVLANKDKADIADHLEPGCSSPGIQSSNAGARRAVPLRSKSEYTPLSISNSEGHTRAFIKIQDGCNHACSFCKVVLVRGRSRSRELKDIYEEVLRLRDAGYRDVSFAGIQLGAYGLDLEKSPHLSEVLYECSKIEGINRLRLSSIEPTDVDERLMDALKDIPECAHHLHIPLQSGDSDILRAMNRRHDRDFYLELIRKLKSKMPDFRLTLDVMVGFPGESEEKFQNTVDLLKEVKPIHCHVFPYSDREGTRAARSEFEKVETRIKKDRVKHLMALSEQLARDVCLPDVGKVADVLVENIKDSHQQENGKYLLQGLTKNFMKVSFVGDESWVGQIVPTELLSFQKGIFLGTVAREESMRIGV